LFKETKEREESEMEYKMGEVMRKKNKRKK